LSPYWVIGIALLVNVYLSLTVDETDLEADQGKVFF
jgi:hypothetical protein